MAQADLVASAVVQLASKFGADCARLIAPSRATNGASPSSNAFSTTSLTTFSTAQSGQDARLLARLPHKRIAAAYSYFASIILRSHASTTAVAG